MSVILFSIIGEMGVAKIYECRYIGGGVLSVDDSRGKPNIKMPTIYSTLFPIFSFFIVPFSFLCKKPSIGEALLLLKVNQPLRVAE